MQNFLNIFNNNANNSTSEILSTVTGAPADHHHVHYQSGGGGGGGGATAKSVPGERRHYFQQALANVLNAHEIHSNGNESGGQDH